VKNAFMWTYGVGEKDAPAESAAHLEGADWPVPLRERSRIVDDTVDLFADWIAQVGDPDERRVAELATPAILAALLKVTVLAAEADAAHCDFSSIPFARRRPVDLDRVLWGHQARSDRGTGASMSDQVISWMRTVRSSSGMFGVRGGIQALIRADRWIVGPSALLLEVARTEHMSFLVESPRNFLGSSTSADPTDKDLEMMANLKRKVLRRLLPDLEARRGLAETLDAGLKREIVRTRHHLAHLRTARSLPAVLWSGSGGSYGSRALALEVRRRGGHVRRFAHGGGFGLDGYGRCRTMIDVCGASEMIVPTRALAAAMVRAGYLPDAARSGPEITGWNGDPCFRAVPRRRPGARVPNRVAYIGTMYTGNHVHVPPVPPGSLYLGWQLRLISALEGMGCEVVCRPHPENDVLLGFQPLSRFLPVSRGPFADTLAQASVMLFDYCFSTAFWEAVCSDVPVVLLDLIGAKFQPETREALARRVVIVEVGFDDRNRPVVDSEALLAAIEHAKRLTDPSDFRRLLAGDEP